MERALEYHPSLISGQINKERVIIVIEQEGIIFKSSKKLIDLKLFCEECGAQIFTY